MSGIPSNATSLSFTQRHAPQSFSDLVFADAAVRQRLSLCVDRQLHRSIILYGPYGSAKSTAARILVRERRERCGVVSKYIDCLSAADLGGHLDVVLNTINCLLLCDPADLYPYVIIDEGDQLSSKDQQRLRQLMDDHQSIRLIVTTNHIDRIDGGLRSRCDCLPLGHPTPDDWLPRAQQILTAEGVSVPPDMLRSVIAHTPDVRDLLTELEILTSQYHVKVAKLPPQVKNPFNIIQGNNQISYSATFDPASIAKLSVIDGGGSSTQSDS